MFRPYSQITWNGYRRSDRPCFSRLRSESREDVDDSCEILIGQPKMAARFPPAQILVKPLRSITNAIREYRLVRVRKGSSIGKK
mmetsp:Transcript_2866/g.5361  ORF Transcript_2866/g.5361 Transcript_2866/m.5361 type:complete len:84 (-) Transcript_2866:12-263(-)